MSGLEARNDLSADIASVLDAALASADGRGFQRRVLDLLDRSVGYSSAFFLGLPALAAPAAPASGLVVDGVGGDYAIRLARDMSRYGREIEPVKQHALAHGGVAVDTEVLGSRARATRYFRDLVRPMGGGHSLLGFLGLRGRPCGVVMLGRESRMPFDAHDVARVRALGPAIALGSMSFAAESSRACEALATTLGLTPRERDISGYLALGFSNGEIARALGTSSNTVRNQLAALFRKAEVSNRAELVGRLLRG
jgi:DNA-binding CsgD family transcriptional regulator